MYDDYNERFRLENDVEEPDLQDYHLCNSCVNFESCKTIKFITAAIKALDISIIIEKCIFYKKE